CTFSFRPWIAFCASSAVSISTKPKPFDLPVWSVMILIDTTLPKASKAGLKESSVAFHDKLPTNNFLFILNSPSLDKKLLTNAHHCEAAPIHRPKRPFRPTKSHH